MSNLSKIEAEKFKVAVRKSNSCGKLMAKDFVKLRRPIYKDYLFHVKQYAGQVIKKQNIETGQISEMPTRIARNNSSYYYRESNQLLSLKQFVILMQESRKRSLRETKQIQRQEERRLRQSVSRHMQQSNEINLRLTTSYVKRLIKNQRKNIIN